MERCKKGEKKVMIFLSPAAIPTQTFWNVLALVGYEVGDKLSSRFFQGEPRYRTLAHLMTLSPTMTGADERCRMVKGIVHRIASW